MYTSWVEDPVVAKDSGNHHSYPQVDTPELSIGAFASATATESGAAEAFIDAVAERIWNKGGGSGDGSGPADIKIDRSKWWVRAAVGVAITAASALAAYQVTEARSVSNKKAIDSHEKLPSHPAAAEEVRLIKSDIKDIKTEVNKIEEIAQGVQSLKQEAQTSEKTRLQEKVKALERENRRLERAR